MKRLFLFAILCFALAQALPAQTPATVTGNLQTLTGGQFGQGSVRFELSNIGTGNPPSVINIGIFPRLVQTVSTSSTGAFTVSLWGNDNINPANTIYLVTFMDNLGNSVGPIQYSITGASVNMNTLAALNGTTPPVLAAAASLTANNAFTGNNTASNINNIRFVDGVKFTTVQSAINDLPVSGGTVSIPPGTYVGPTSIPNSNISLVCQSWLGCTLTYTAAQTLGPNGSALDNIKLDGLIFDFGNNNGGLTLQNFRGSQFKIQVQNTGTAAGLTLFAPNNTVNLNFMRNYFPWVKVINAGSGLVLNGDANIAACGGPQGNGGAVFDNTFGRVYLTGITGPHGMQFTSGTDSMDFQQVFIDLAAGNTTGDAINFNSRCTSQAADVGLLYFSHLTVEFTGVLATYTGHLIVAGNSVVKFGQITGSNVSVNNILSADPNAFITGIWDDVSPFSISVPYSASNRPIVQQTYVPASAGANNYAPPVQWSSQMWNGSGSIGSTWQAVPTAQGSGVPTFDTLLFQNIGTPNSNGFAGLGVQVPNRIIIAGPTNILGKITHANTADRNYTLPDSTGNIPSLPTVTTTETGSGAVVKATSPALTTPTIGGGTTLTKYSRFSVSLSPALVAANTCAAQSFTVTGIAAADILIAVSKPTEQAGLSVGLGHVTAANTATVNFCNNTAAGITPTAAETYQFVTIQ